MGPSLLKTALSHTLFMVLCRFSYREFSSIVGAQSRSRPRFDRLCLSLDPLLLSIFLMALCGGVDSYRMHFGWNRALTPSHLCSSYRSRNLLHVQIWNQHSIKSKQGIQVFSRNSHQLCSENLFGCLGLQFLICCLFLWWFLQMRFLESCLHPTRSPTDHTSPKWPKAYNTTGICRVPSS